MTVRAYATRAKMKDGGVGAVTADDLYRAAVRLQSAPIPWRMALVTGFGEGAEEVAQTMLDAHAVGQTASETELVQSAIAGFAMGAGMSFGVRVGAASKDNRDLNKANSLLTAIGQP